MQVLVKMSLYAPSKLLIENYMIEIARAFNVPFVPDASAMEVIPLPYRTYALYLLIKRVWYITSCLHIQTYS